MESLANALAIIGFEPGKLVVLFLFIIIVYAVCRVVDGWIGSPWIKKVNDEIVLYEKISSLNNERSNEDAEWESLLKLKRHIEFTVNRHTTRLDHIKQYIEGFRFTLIGLFSYFVVLLWQLAWNEVDLGNKEQVLLLIILFAALLIVLLISDLIRIVWDSTLSSKLKSFISSYRIKYKSRELAKRSKSNLEQLKRAEKASCDFMSNASTADFDDLTIDVLTQLRKLIQKQIEEEEKLKQHAVERKAGVVKFLDSSLYGHLTRANMRQIETSELMIIDATEQAIKTLKKIDACLPN